MLNPGLHETLVEMRTAIETRITNGTNRLGTTPSFHRGIPTPNAMPEEALGVWLTWDSVGPDSDEPNNSTMLIWRWHIYIAAPSEANDSFGSHSSLVERAWGEIQTAFSQTNDDIGLDGSADFTVTMEASNGYGTTSGGNQSIQVVECILTVHGSMELVRDCPTP